MSLLHNKINILDCILRGGHYYNQWKFDKNLKKKFKNQTKFFEKNNV